MNKLVLAIGLVLVGTMILVQQNATNQNQTNSTGTGYTYSNSAQAKPDHTKFCDVFNNDDGTQGQDCTWKSKGECKKSDRAQGQDFAGCVKREKGNDLTPDEGGEGGGSGPDGNN